MGGSDYGGAARGASVIKYGCIRQRRAGELAQVTRCLEVCFTQRVNLYVPRSEAVPGVRG